MAAAAMTIFLMVASLLYSTVKRSGFSALNPACASSCFARACRCSGVQPARRAGLQAIAARPRWGKGPCRLLAVSQYLAGDNLFVQRQIQRPRTRRSLNGARRLLKAK